MAPLRPNIFKSDGLIPQKICSCNNAGHTATRLEGGELLIAGGASNANQLATDTLMRRGEQGRSVHAGNFNEARTGHTATRLPDGRVLFLGGSKTGDLQSADDLVETAEIYDPGESALTVVPMRGAPICRALHTADLRLVDGDLVVDVVGGRGDAGSGLKVRGDLRRFVFRNDTLVAVDPNPGLSLAANPVFGQRTRHAAGPLCNTQPAVRISKDLLFAKSVYVRRWLSDRLKVAAGRFA